MSLLLDTHVWVWLVAEPDRLSARAREAIEAQPLWLSPISAWECLLLIERGRLRVGMAAEEWVRAALRSGPFHEAAMNHEVALRARKIDVDHADPADRFLAATAAVFGLTLVTADRRLLGRKGFEAMEAA